MMVEWLNVVKGAVDITSLHFCIAVQHFYSFGKYEHVLATVACCLLVICDCMLAFAFDIHPVLAYLLAIARK